MFSDIFGRLEAFFGRFWGSQVISLLGIRLRPSERRKLELSMDGAILQSKKAWDLVEAVMHGIIYHLFKN